MLARMELILICVFLIGVGALWLGVAGRRAAERSVLAPTRPASRTGAVRPPSRVGEEHPPSRAREESGAAAPVEIPAPGPESEQRPAPAPLPPARIPDAAPAERRKHPRIRSDQTFTVTPFAGRAMMAQCIDLSEGGMRFGIVGCTLRAGDLVRVTFNVGSETVGAIGSVLRIEELDPITTEVSLEFVRLDPWATQLIGQALQDGAA